MDFIKLTAQEKQTEHSKCGIQQHGLAEAEIEKLPTDEQ